DTTISLRYMKPIPTKTRKKNEELEIENRIMPKSLFSKTKSSRPSPEKEMLSPMNIPSPFENFEGTDNLCGCLPPDTNGAVGPNNFVQVVNNHIQVFNKHG